MIKKIFLFLALVAICSAKLNLLVNLSRGQFCEIILILDHWFRRFHLKIFLILSSTNHFSAEQNHLCNFDRGHHEEHFCEIILNLDQWFRIRRHLNTFII